MKFQVWPYRFHVQKAIQAVAILLRHASAAHKRDNYTRILKLLYLTERRCLEQRARPLLGDSVSAMKNGPVLSDLYNLILNRHFESFEWNKFIAQDRFDIVLIADPDNDLLSPFEIGLIEQVANEYVGWDQWELIELCHKLPEWIAYQPREDGPQSIAIPFSAILDTMPAIRDRAIEWANEQGSFDRLFSRAC